MQTISQQCTWEEFTTAMSQSQQANLVVQLLHKLVRLVGNDYRDPLACDSAGCEYWDPEEGTPLCIVGHVLQAIGIDVANMPNRDISMLFGVGNRLDGMCWQAVTMLCAAQRAQDVGATWEQAVNAAQGVWNMLQLAGQLQPTGTFSR